MQIQNIHPRAYLLYIEDISDSDVEQFIAQLPQWRREQALAFKHQQGRKECALAYILLRHALREEFGIDEDVEFEYSEHGKPSLRGRSDIYFNMSHCRQAVACIVGTTPVGIDVECKGRYKEQLARHVMNEEELSQIASSTDRDTVFTRLWTQKEAILKLTGEGVSSDMKNTISRHPNLHLHTESNEKIAWSIAVDKKE